MTERLPLISIAVVHVLISVWIAWSECKADRGKRFGDEFAGALVIGFIIYPIVLMACVIIPCDMFCEWLREKLNSIVERDRKK